MQGGQQVQQELSGPLAQPANKGAQGRLGLRVILEAPVPLGHKAVSETLVSQERLD